MNVEEIRLRTFSDWPSNAAVQCDRIAKAGLFYTGVALEVQCFVCHVKITRWNYGDQAMARHRQANPTCPFVLNPSGTCNVPLISSPATSTANESTGTRTQDSSPSATLTSASDATESFQLSQEQTVMENAPVSESVWTGCGDPRVQYRTEAQRLQSFTNWPIPSIVSPERLAKAGFYYLQEGDMVQCVFCRGIVLKWEPGDDPDIEHRRHFPTCDFYLHRDNEQVLTMERVELENVKLTSGAPTDLMELGIQTHMAPQRPKHVTYEGRLRTFQGWPQGLRQTPEMLADAGFYYVGVGDQVRCYYCDGGLRNWEVTDDAWTEHAKWFPKCGFVSLVRGQEFIKHCIDNRPPLDPSIFVGVSTEGSGDITETHLPSLSTVAPPVIRNITDSDVAELLTTAPALAALEIGLQVGQVKSALRQRMERTGIPYTNADELIEDVLQISLQDDDNSSDTHTPESPSMELTSLLSEIIATRQNTNADIETEPSNVEARVRENIPGIGDAVPDHKCSEVPEASKITEEKKTTESRDTISLEEENRRLKEARLCKICMDREVGVVFLPCGHLSTCVHCAPSLKHCPMCRREIRATVRTFLA